MPEESRKMLEQKSFTWRNIPIRSHLSFRKKIPGHGIHAELAAAINREASRCLLSERQLYGLEEAARRGRERLIDAQLELWKHIDGVTYPREHAARRVDLLAAEVVVMMKTLNAVADGWETKADRIEADANRTVMSRHPGYLLKVTL
jgi:hypothetical protein